VGEINSREKKAAVIAHGKGPVGIGRREGEAPGFILLIKTEGHVIVETYLVGADADRNVRAEEWECSEH